MEWGESRTTTAEGRRPLQFGHDGDVMEWGQGGDFRLRRKGKLQFGHDGDVMEWLVSPPLALASSSSFNSATTVMSWNGNQSGSGSAANGSFNSATTVMSWNGHYPREHRHSELALQFGHDGDVMEWTTRSCTCPPRSRLQFGHDGDVMEWYSGRRPSRPESLMLQFGHDGDVMEWIARIVTTLERMQASIRPRR